MTIVIPKIDKNSRRNDKKFGKKDKNLKAIKRPRGIEANYRTALFKVNDALKKALEPINNLVSQGASPAEVANAIDQQFQRTTNTTNLAAPAISSEFVDKSNKVNKQRVESVYKQAFSVNSATIIDQPNVQEALDLATLENVSLIRSIPQDFWGDVTQAIVSNFRGVQQVGNVTLQQRLKKIGGISDSKSKVIARDQTKKVSSGLTRIRHRNVGVKKYIWHNVDDERVVGNPSGLYPKGSHIHLNHWIREGKLFYYDRPPPDGHPGTAILCRCWEEPILDIDDSRIILT